jgi:hypothetical protein
MAYWCAPVRTTSLGRPEFPYISPPRLSLCISFSRISVFVFLQDVMRKSELSRPPMRPWGAGFGGQSSAGRSSGISPISTMYHRISILQRLPQIQTEVASTRLGHGSCNCDQFFEIVNCSLWNLCNVKFIWWISMLSISQCSVFLRCVWNVRRHELE